MQQRQGIVDDSPVTGDAKMALTRGPWRAGAGPGIRQKDVEMEVVPQGG